MLKFRLDSRKPNLTEPMTIRFGVSFWPGPASSSQHPAQHVCPSGHSCFVVVCGGVWGTQHARKVLRCVVISTGPLCTRRTIMKLLLCRAGCAAAGQRLHHAVHKHIQGDGTTFLQPTTASYPNMLVCVCSAQRQQPKQVWCRQGDGHLSCYVVTDVHERDKASINECVGRLHVLHCSGVHLAAAGRHAP